MHAIPLTIESRVGEHANLLSNVTPGSWCFQFFQTASQSLTHFNNSPRHRFNAIHPKIHCERKFRLGNNKYMSNCIEN